MDLTALLTITATGLLAGAFALWQPIARGRRAVEAATRTLSGAEAPVVPGAPREHARLAATLRTLGRLLDAREAHLLRAPEAAERFRPPEALNEAWLQTEAPTEAARDGRVARAGRARPEALAGAWDTPSGLVVLVGEAPGQGLDAAVLASVASRWIGARLATHAPVVVLREAAARFGLARATLARLDAQGLTRWSLNAEVRRDPGSGPWLVLEAARPELDAYVTRFASLGPVALYDDLRAILAEDPDVGAIGVVG